MISPELIERTDGRLLGTTRSADVPESTDATSEGLSRGASPHLDGRLLAVHVNSVDIAVALDDDGREGLDGMNVGSSHRNDDFVVLGNELDSLVGAGEVDVGTSVDLSGHDLPFMLRRFCKAGTHVVARSSLYPSFTVSGGKS